MRATLFERVADHGSPLRGVVSKAWRRYALRNVGSNDNHSGLERLYALPDPWDMASASEQSRFGQTNIALDRLSGRVNTILEVGSGEGHQSRYLSRLCDRLYGFDVSARAVSRAQSLLPHCHFGEGRLPGPLPWTLGSGEKYDLVVACEVLYYLKDIDAAVRQMSSLGRRCFVSFYAPYASLMAPRLQDVCGASRGWMHHHPSTWLWIYWTP
jgi:SAM-dependent methyltransferase